MDGRGTRVGWYNALSGVGVDSPSLLSMMGAVHCVSLRLMRDINTVGWDHIVDISDDFAKISLNLGGNVFSVVITPMYPQERPILTTGLFPDQDFPWCAHDGLQRLCSLYTKSIAEHQLFFQRLEDLEHRACIVASSTQPPVSNGQTVGQSGRSVLIPSTETRTVVVASTPEPVYCEITVQPGDSGQVPKLRFFGSEVRMQELQNRWERLQHHWKHEKPITWNLENVLMEGPLPLPGAVAVLSSLCSVGDRSLSVPAPAPPSPLSNCFCSICYTSEHSAPNDAIISCNNFKCGHHYHADCVRRWILESGNCKISFGVTFGVCPYCTSTLQVADDSHS